MSKLIVDAGEWLEISKGQTEVLITFLDRLSTFNARYTGASRLLLETWSVVIAQANGTAIERQTLTRHHHVIANLVDAIEVFGDMQTEFGESMRALAEREGTLIEKSEEVED